MRLVDRHDRVSVTNLPRIMDKLSPASRAVLAAPPRPRSSVAAVAMLSALLKQRGRPDGKE